MTLKASVRRVEKECQKTQLLVRLLYCSLQVYLEEGPKILYMLRLLGMPPEAIVPAGAEDSSLCWSKVSLRVSASLVSGTAGHFLY